MNLGTDTIIFKILLLILEEVWHLYVLAVCEFCLYYLKFSITYYIDL